MKMKRVLLLPTAAQAEGLIPEIMFSLIQIVASWLIANSRCDPSYDSSWFSSNFSITGSP